MSFGILLESSASAGDYHSGSTLRCNDCHVMHFSQSHGYSNSAIAFGSRRLAGTPQRGLLAGPVNDLCLTCHDGNAQATDVLDSTNTGSQPAIVRTAGYLGRFGSSPLHGGHTLDSLDVAPASTPPWSPQGENGLGIGLQCTNCHDPHGATSAMHPTGGQYRNLRDNPGNAFDAWVTYNSGTPGVNDLSRNVFLRQLRDYDESEMDWNEPSSRDSAIARWCLGCHGQIHGGNGGSGGGLPEHPFEGDDLDGEMLVNYNGKANRVKVMSEIGNWSPAGQDVTPTCITCHRAHGNANQFGLIFRSGLGIPTEDGDTGGSTRSDLCRQCHDSGSPFQALGSLTRDGSTAGSPAASRPAFSGRNPRTN